MAIYQRPLPLCLPLDEYDDDHRHFDCSGYAACLEYAAQEGWPSWSCATCEARCHRTEIFDVERLEFEGGIDWAPSTRVIYDPNRKKVVAGRHLVCHARDKEATHIQVSLVVPGGCPMCYEDLWGDEVLVGKNGICSAGHSVLVDEDGEIAVG
jgi:hypothetical protein